MKAVAHVHTSHSWDSLLSPRQLVRALTAKGVELAIITDHNSFGGALEARAYVAEQGLQLEIPIAAEIRTELGDVIVVVPDGPPPLAESLVRWADLEFETRARGGLIWLPHPYRRHSDDAADRIGAAADLIEVFNSRCDSLENSRAMDLCVRHGKVPTVGMDAHLAREATRWVVDYEPRESILATIGQSPTWSRSVYSKRPDIHAAEAINSLKQIRSQLANRRLNRAFYHVARGGYHTFRIVQTTIADGIRAIASPSPEEP